LNVQQQKIGSAWNAVKAIEPDLLKALKTTARLDDIVHSGMLGICNNLNVGMDRMSPRWGDDGNGTVKLTDLSINDIESLSIQDAQFPPGSPPSVEFPIAIKSLEIKGKYNYTQPCSRYLFFVIKRTDSLTGTGKVTDALNQGKVIFVYDMQPDSARISFREVRLDGASNITYDDGSGVMANLARAILGGSLDTARRANLLNVIATANFRSMIEGKIKELLA